MVAFTLKTVCTARDKYRCFPATFFYHFMSISFFSLSLLLWFASQHTNTQHCIVHFRLPRRHWISVCLMMCDIAENKTFLAFWIASTREKKRSEEEHDLIWGWERRGEEKNVATESQLLCARLLSPAQIVDFAFFDDWFADSRLNVLFAFLVKRLDATFFGSVVKIVKLFVCAFCR
jgi:hypothetical protein